MSGRPEGTGCSRWGKHRVRVKDILIEVSNMWIALYIYSSREILRNPQR